MNYWLVGALTMVIFGSSCAIGDAGDAGSDIPAPLEDTSRSEKPELRTAVLASGCFWCTEAVFRNVAGVTKAVSGYAGDKKENADYKTVSSHGTNHAECVQVTYDASKVTYGRLLQAFFTTHDPTTLDRQGPDTGRQYRSAIFYADDQQKRIAEAYIKQLNAAKVFDKPIVTTVEKLSEFFPAETYHQDYAQKNPAQAYIQRYALPKAEKAKKKFGTTQPTH